MDLEETAAHREAVLRAASRTLAELLDSDPEARRVLSETSPLLDRPSSLAAIRKAFDAGGMSEVRRERRRRLLGIAASDLAGEQSLEDVGAALAALADSCLEVTLSAVEAPGELSVIAMGKLGAQELNYVSDIDVMFVTTGNPAGSTRAAEMLLATLGEFTPDGRAYVIDANLRPEGRNGALVRSLDGYLEYYARWAKHWEHQALIKARSAAGNHEAGRRLVEETRALVFPFEISADRISDMRKMKQKVEDNALRVARRSFGAQKDDVKLGPGGIRDIEFAVQLLQLVHGGGDPSVRTPATLGAISKLVAGGYLAEEDGAGLSVAYRWLRAVEHRLQLYQELRVVHIPTEDAKRAAVARSMGFSNSPMGDAASRFENAHRSVLADVRIRFEKLFYRPMIESLSGAAGARLSKEAIRDRLRLLGFRDVDRAARNLDELVSGTSRRARLFRILSPAFLRFVAATPLPDQGLFSFLRLGELLSDRVDALGALRDNPPGLRFLAQVLGSGRVLGEALGHVPEELQTIADPEGPDPAKDRDQLAKEAVASLQWRDQEDKLDGLRRFKRREVLRVMLADIAARTDALSVGEALSDVAEAVLEAALEDERAAVAIVGMGKLGGRELGYASDIDVMFVHDGDQLAAEKVAERLLSSVGEVTAEGKAFAIDAGLRPEGKSGPLARSLRSCLEYYERWSRPWEHLALTKARFVAGDEEVGARFAELARSFAYPARLDSTAVAEIRHLKARMERERIPRGTDPRRNLKLGPGGMSDVEFASQMLQLEHAGSHPTLQTISTVKALEEASRLGLVDAEAARRMIAAYRFLAQLRNRLFLITARPLDGLPVKPEELEALGISMGFSDQPRQELEEHYLMLTRRARRAAEPLIYGV